ncbi:MAG: M48 family metallopeptidase [Gemmiger sp.]|nr:M48 family metallopeptidase [Gemmiger sp.]
MAEAVSRTAGGVAYALTRRRVKNINLRVRADGTVAASAAPWVPARQVDAFVAQRADWVAATRRRLAARAGAEAAIAAALPPKAEALATMQGLCLRYWPQFAPICPGGMPTVKVRDMTSRWGSCNLRTNTLTFSLRLCAMPAAAQEYVVVHEFCHFAQPNHSPAFWAVVARHMPDYAARRALLRAPVQVPRG